MTASPTPQKKRRKIEPQERRKAILDAGLEVFAAKGFAAAKLDVVAAKAGVAKGTIYLYFKDKSELFEAIARNAISPVMSQLQEIASLPNRPTRALLNQLFEVARREVLLTDRKLVARLVLTEGARFPEIAGLYYREVIAKGLAIVRLIADRGIERGEAEAIELKRFPHLVFAPVILALIWDGIFEPFAPLDVEGLLRAHVNLLAGSATKSGDRE